MESKSIDISQKLKNIKENLKSYTIKEENIKKDVRSIYETVGISPQSQCEYLLQRLVLKLVNSKISNAQKIKIVDLACLFNSEFLVESQRKKLSVKDVKKMTLYLEMFQAAWPEITDKELKESDVEDYSFKIELEDYLLFFF